MGKANKATRDMLEKYPTLSIGTKTLAFEFARVDVALAGELNVSIVDIGESMTTY